MGLRHYFEYRPGRIIAVFRAALALVFLLAMIFEPADGGDKPQAAVELLSIYFAWSLALVAVAWSGWWHDERLAMPALAVDISVFVAATYLAEAADLDFTSPFMAFFALIMLSVTMRWDWRLAARVGAIATILYIAAGMLAGMLDVPLDPGRFLRRISYMIALFLVLAGFAIQRREPQLPPMAAAGRDDDDGFAPLDAALGYAMAQTGAIHGAISWSSDEEPWTELRLHGPGGARARQRLGPGELDEVEAEQPGHPFLFDTAHARCLTRDQANRSLCARLADRMPLAALAGIGEGLAIPFETAEGRGRLIVGGIDGMSAEHIALARIIARETASVFDRHAVAELEREALGARLRSVLARDLHDSVAQSLAGACFRLEGLRKAIERGADPVSEIVEVRDALRGEQGHVRALIERLRQPVQSDPASDLATDLAGITRDCARQWGIEVRLEAKSGLAVTGWLSLEVQALLREAIANAARHGKARHVSIDLAAREGALQLEIVDDGSGMPGEPGDSRPWSISERVAELGGRFDVAPANPGTRLSISLPNGGPA